MTFTVRIGLENAAFEQDPASETARIIRALADRIEAGDFPAEDEPMSLRDWNGNRVGEAEVEP